MSYDVIQCRTILCDTVLDCFPVISIVLYIIITATLNCPFVSHHAISRHVIHTHTHTHTHTLPPPLTHEHSVTLTRGPLGTKCCPFL